MLTADAKRVYHLYHVCWSISCLGLRATAGAHGAQVGSHGELLTPCPRLISGFRRAPKFVSGNNQSKSYIYPVVISHSQGRWPC